MSPRPWDAAGGREVPLLGGVSTAASLQGPPSPRLLDGKAHPAELLLLAPSFTLTWGLSLSSPRELSHNQIEELPSLHRCQKLEEM